MATANILNNLARLLCMRIEFNIVDQYTIMSRRLLTKYSHRIINNTTKHHGIEITTNNQKYGFNILMDKEDKISKNIFDTNVKVLPTQYLVDNKKQKNPNIWAIRDLYIDQPSSSLWIDFSLMRPEKRTIFEFTISKTNKNIPLLSYMEIQCNILCPFDKNEISTNTLIVFHRRCFEYSDEVRKVSSITKKTFSNS